MATGYNQKKLLLVFLTTALAALLAYEIFRFHKYSWYFVGLHTRLLPYFLCLYIVAIAVVRNKLLITNKLIITSTSVVVAMMVAEVGLALLSGEPEKQFYEQFKVDTQNYYHKYPDSPRNIFIHTAEFTHSRSLNRYGFADKEWADSLKNCLRIICLGDSYTEGYGAPADSAYPAILQEKFSAAFENGNIEVLNAGTCGSDPLFNYMNLQDRLFALKPDIVIQTISSNDLLKDIPLRGGWERFRADGTLSPPPENHCGFMWGYLAAWHV